MTRRFLVLALLASLAVLSAADPWDDSRKAFLPKYKSKDAKEREAAVRALKDYNTRDAMDFMVTLFLEEPDAVVQAAWVDMIAGVIDGEGRKRFYDLCRGGKPVQRVKLIAILGRGGYRDEMDVLKGFTHEAEPLVRRAGYEAIAAAQFHSMEPVVRAGLTDPEADVRVAAARAVSVFRSEESVPALVKVLEDAKESADVKLAVADALGGITGQKFGTDPAPWQTWLDGRKGMRITAVDVDRALDRASKWIINLHPTGYAGTEEAMELELYALIHAGIPLDNVVVKSAITQLYKKPMARVYNVAIGAMALADISPTIHQAWLARAAEYLVNWQADNGQFSYGEALPGDTPSLAAPEVTPDSKPEFGGGTKALKKIPVRQNPKRKGAKYGDNSNTQYAVLGLRACAESQIDIPKEVWVNCMTFLKGNNTQEGSFTYSPAYAGGNYGSIHTSALGAYIVCRYYAGHGMKRDTVIDKGLDWLAQNFAVDENPKQPNPRAWVYYYLYGMERVGALTDTETFGKHEWYQEGAKYLIAAQTAGGDWNNDSRDTAWAILFLRRATRPVGKVEDK